MDTKELLKKVRKIEIKTRGLSNHIFSGEYHSAFKGRGMSFSEVREYQYGDDVRSIDWNVTARFNHPYVKVFEEERELTVILMVDVSQSGFFGTQNQMKNEILTEIAATLAFSAINNNDKVGVIFFSDQIEKLIPPKKGKTHILRIVRELINFQPDHSTTNLEQALQYLTNMMKKRAIVFLLSDFMTEGYESALNIANKRHDIVGIRLFDLRERDLPNAGLIKMKDAESGREMWVDTASKRVRQAHRLSFEAYFDYARKAFTKSGADLVSIDTRDSYPRALMSFFKKREYRR